MNEISIGFTYWFSTKKSLAERGANIRIVEVVAKNEIIALFFNDIDHKKAHKMSIPSIWRDDQPGAGNIDRQSLYLRQPSRGIITNLIHLISVSAIKKRLCICINNTHHENFIGTYDPSRSKDCCCSIFV
jgi:hypothetical protein